MAITAGTQVVYGRLYDMTGAANYSAGTDLGKLSDLIMPEFEREVTLYDLWQYGSTPNEASIDGASITLEFALSEYNSSVLKLLSQNMKKTGTTLTYSGPQGSTYPLGNPLSATYAFPLLVADKEMVAATTPENKPALYIPRAVVTRVRNLSFSFAENIMDPAVFTVVGLYDSDIGGPFIVGQTTDFPSLS